MQQCSGSMGEEEGDFSMQFKNDGIRFALWGLSASAGAILWAALIFNTWPTDSFVLFEMIFAACFGGEIFEFIAVRNKWLSAFEEFELRVGKTYGRYENAWLMVLTPYAVLFYGSFLLIFASTNISLNSANNPLAVISVLWALWAVISIVCIHDCRSRARLLAGLRFDSQPGLAA